MADYERQTKSDDYISRDFRYRDEDLERITRDLARGRKVLTERQYLEFKEHLKREIIKKPSLRIAKKSSFQELRLIADEVIGNLFNRVEFLKTRINELESALVERQEIDQSQITEIASDVEEKKKKLLTLSNIDDIREFELDITNLKMEDLELIVDKNNGDLRGVINDIQGIGQGKIEGDVRELILSLHRDSLEEIFTLIRDLFKVSTLREARSLADKSDVDYNFLYKWINENLLSFIKSNRDLTNAFENLSLADEIFGRIRTTQYWGLLPYFFDLFAGGVALSRQETPITKGFRRVVFPRYTTGSYFSLTNVEKEFVEKLKRKYEISQIDFIQDILPFLKILCGASRKQLKTVSDWLELDAKEKKILK